MSAQTPTTAPDATIDPQRLIDHVTCGLAETANEIVPWFAKQMPLMYFQDTDEADQVSHLRAIIAAKASGRPIEFTLRRDDGSEWTSMREQDYCGVLAELARELPMEPPLRTAKIHTAQDGKLVVDTFIFGDTERFDPADPAQASKLKAALEYAGEHLPDADMEELSAHIHRCPAEYVHGVTPLRLCRHWELLTEISCTDGTLVSLEPERDPTVCRIVVAASNAKTRSMLERIATRLSADQINIHRAYLDLIDDGDHGTISMLGFVVEGPDGGPLQKDGELFQRVKRDLHRIKWLDKRTLDLAYRNPELDFVRAELITGLCDLCHQKLVKVNPYAYNPDRMVRFAEKNIKHAQAIADLFLERFNPTNPLDDNEAFLKRCDDMQDAIGSNVDLPEARQALQTMIDAVKATYRTNVYVEKRYGLGMRLNPTFMQTEDRPELPFGIFFVHGRAFNGFHVRFRDIARGGVRAVVPHTDDQHSREVERLYDEAYQLSFAQQLKNKDIPEGGAKAAMLLEPGIPVERSVKGFVDTLLDMITPDPAVRSCIVDYFGQEELLYLGPDENITPDLINWIVDRAELRGYPTPTALMSSKPGAGINHKDYGVTSEGVNEFLDIALQHVGIDPRKQPFTVKMTGGPDGDVGGNCIRIMKREFGDNPRVVGIADGSGVGEDPDGLNLDELMRLVEGSLPIAEFDPSKLGPNGRVVSLNDPDGVHLRNTLHNRLEADAFVPCGGRPSAMNESNWREFLKADGTPSSGVIVEGANLFLTPPARIGLSNAGALILKDSSANKCGVICSSFEIISCMLMDAKELLEIKETFVSQVLVRLRELARLEASLLMRVHAHLPDVPLPELSIRLSKVALHASDAIQGAIETMLKKDEASLRELVIQHMPPILVERVGDELWSRLPERYVQWIMAKSLAMHMVYRDGFEFLETMPAGSIAKLALEYLSQERERKALIDEVSTSEIPSRDRIATLLEHAGIFSTLR